MAFEQRDPEVSYVHSPIMLLLWDHLAPVASDNEGERMSSNERI